MSKARDLADGTFDTDTLVVDAANNRVGVGTSSPTATLESLGGQLRIGASTAGSMFLVNPSTTYSDGVDLQATYNGGGSYGPMKFSAGGSEAMRIDNSQRLLVGTPSTLTTNAVVQVNCDIFSPGQAFASATASTGVIYHNLFYNGNGLVGGIYTNGSSTTFETSSDYRLKENVVDLTGASERVNQIPVHRFNFIADPDTTVDGFLAHEVQSVVPEAISGTQDEVDEDGNPVYQGIDQSKLVPLLTAALQEALSEIADLKTRVAALETS